MTNTYKVLGQSSPAANTDTTLYTVPALTQTVVSSIVVCNQNAAAKKFRVYVQVAGVALDIKQYLYFDVSVAATDTFVATLGITLGAADVVTVRANATALSFNLFGMEIS